MMTEDDIMPFGKHKGERLGDVPASYLVWLWDNTDLEDEETPLSEYVEMNLENLRMDAWDEEDEWRASW